MPRYKLRTLLILLAGAFIVLFGLGCLNYTKARGLEHHREFARLHGLPEPSEAILFSGAALLLLGGGVIGYLIGGHSPTRRT